MSTALLDTTIDHHRDDAHGPPIANRPSAVLLDEIESNAATSDRNGTLVRSYDRMVADGLFHLLVPTDLGGASATVTEWFDTAVDVATADPSAGWLLAQGAAQTAWIAVAGSDDLVGEFFTTRHTLASTAAGDVTAEHRGDHYRLTNARWAYASGSSGATYLGGAVRTIAPDGAPETRMMLVPAEQATIRPTWDTLGLRGTASNHIDFGDTVDIPLERTFTWPRLTVRRAGPLACAISHTGWMITLSAAAVNIGAARRSIRAALDSAVTKKHRFDAIPLLQQSTFVRGIAELESRLELATSGLRALLDHLWDRALGGHGPDLETRARLRLAATASIDLTADIVQQSQALVGADALHRSHVLERLGRDSQMLRHHVAASPSTREQLARILLDSYDGPTSFI